MLILHIFHEDELDQSATIAIALPLAIRTSRLFIRVDGAWRQLHHHGSLDDATALADYQAAVAGKAA